MPITTSNSCVTPASSGLSALLILLFFTPSATASPVQLQRQGEILTATFTVPVMPERAWTVLTDYVKTGEAMPDITEVKLLSRNGNTVRLMQIYNAPYTFGLPIKAVLEVTEKPKTTILYRMIDGDQIKKLSGSWKIMPFKSGTRIVHRITLVPEIPSPLQAMFNGLFQSSLRNSLQRLSERMQLQDQLHNSKDS